MSLQLLADLVAQRADRRIVEVGRQLQGLIPPVRGDVLPLGPQSHNVRAIALYGGGSDSLDPAVAEEAYSLQVKKLEDIRDVEVATYNNMPVYVRQIARAIWRT